MAQKSETPKRQWTPEEQAVLRKKREEKNKAAAEFFSLLREQQELEDRLRVVRARGRELLRAHPFLGNMVGCITSAAENEMPPPELAGPSRSPKRPPESEPTAMEVESPLKRTKATRKSEKRVDPLHYHEDAATGEKVACRDFPCTR